MTNIIKITFAIIGIVIGAGFASRSRDILIFLYIWKMGDIRNNNSLNAIRNNYL